jgi:hypothetical protein
MDIHQSIQIPDNIARYIGKRTAPEHDGHTLINITCGVGFEPFGLASETWESVWMLELPLILHHWRSTKGWRLGSNLSRSDCMYFAGKTLEEVLVKADHFLSEMAEEGLAID